MINSLRNLIFRDFWLKFFSLILALGVWKVVSKAVENKVSPGSATSAIKIERTFSGVNVLVVSSAADVRNFKVRPEEVEVTFRGESQFLENLKAGDIRAIVDLTDIESAHGLSKRIEISIPVGLTLLKVSPAEVDVVVPPKQ